ncbi:MAG: SDR family oxidoreductase [Myxococcales bacterium]|jgi:short-subunit dehydrogenase
MESDVFSGTFALVTGASSGLGEEFARQLAHRGCNLVLSGRSREKLETLAADLSRINGVATRVVTADLAQPGGAEQLALIVDDLGVTIDHLINNAGFGSAGNFAESDAHRQTTMVRVNCESIVCLAGHFLPGMVKRNRGGIINVGSTAAYQPTPFMATYGASKAFVVSFSAALASELEKSEVRVLACCPGPVPTGFQAAAGMPEGSILSFAKLEPNDVVQSTLDAYASGRVVYVPGAVNSMQTTLSKMLPRAVVVRAAKYTMRKLGRA